MKILAVGILFLFCVSGFAASRSYCDGIRRIDYLPRLSVGQFQEFLRSGENVDRIVVSKERRWLYLLQNDVVIKAYRIALGASPMGPKRFAGDHKTPEGVYVIDGKNASSGYHKALHVSYPNADDVAYARARGRSPGGSIMIHGFPNDPRAARSVRETHPTFNWTAGCVAVTNAEIDEIFELVERGTTIEICAFSSGRD